MQEIIWNPQLVPFHGIRPRKAGGRLVYKVEGRGEFPTDMLRYDAAWPRNEGAQILGRDRRTVELTALGCTPKRWESFGWNVVVEGGIKEVQP